MAGLGCGAAVQASEHSGAPARADPIGDMSQPIAVLSYSGMDCSFTTFTSRGTPNIHHRGAESNDLDLGGEVGGTADTAWQPAHWYSVAIGAHGIA